MNQFLTGPLLVAVALLFITTTPATAQQLRPDHTFFVRPQVGVASYLGDNERALFPGGSFPVNAGLEFGYQFTYPWSLGASYHYASYPTISPSGSGDDARHSTRLILRYTLGRSTWRVAPYLQTGAHLTFGEVRAPGALTDEWKTSAGPLAGLGFDVALNRRTSFFLEANTTFNFGDDATDGRDDGGFGNTDLLGGLGAGLKFNLNRAFRPVIFGIDGPSRLEAGQRGTFSAQTNHEKASRPVEHQWSFGDGTTASGLTVTHAYARAGTYTVSFTARSGKQADTRSMVVEVVPAVVPAGILTVTAHPMKPDTETPVAFSANVRGDAPLTYEWDFGDGATGTGATPTHTFAEAGSYTVTLRLSNKAGADTRTLVLAVVPYEAEVCRDLTVMNPVYFERNGSVLTDRGRAALRENLSILQECPNVDARLEGFAAPGERNPQRLSEDRARAVEQFYMAEGIAPSRLMTVGKGIVSATTSKKEGASQYQRVDTIPLRQRTGASW